MIFWSIIEPDLKIDVKFELRVTEKMIEFCRAIIAIGNSSRSRRHEQSAQSEKT